MNLNHACLPVPAPGHRGMVWTTCDIPLMPTGQRALKYRKKHPLRKRGFYIQNEIKSGFSVTAGSLGACNALACPVPKEKTLNPALSNKLSRNISQHYCIFERTFRHELMQSSDQLKRASSGVFPLRLLSNNSFWSIRRVRSRSTKLHCTVIDRTRRILGVQYAKISAPKSYSMIWRQNYWSKGTI